MQPQTNDQIHPHQSTRIGKPNDWRCFWSVAGAVTAGRLLLRALAVYKRQRDHNPRRLLSSRSPVRDWKVFGSQPRFSVGGGHSWAFPRIGLLDLEVAGDAHVPGVQTV